MTIPKKNTLSMVYQHIDFSIHVITTNLKTYESNDNGLLVGQLPVAKYIYICVCVCEDKNGIHVHNITQCLALILWALQI